MPGLALPAAGRELAGQGPGAGRAGLEGLGETVESIEEFARGSEDLSSRLHHEVLASRMRPLADGIRGFPRLVRDLARELGKQAQFEVVGETTGVDRDILDRLEAPAQPPDPQRPGPRPRDARGAPRRRQAPGRHDPPGGPPPRRDAPDRPRRRRPRHRPGAAPRQGRRAGADRPPPMARRLGEAELLDFLFLPGFSTKEQVTDVSGRGRRAGRRAQHGARGARLGPHRQPARQGDAVHPPAPDHRLGHPRPAGRDRRRALRLPPEPDRPHPDARPPARSATSRGSRTSCSTTSSWAWSRRRACSSWTRLGRPPPRPASPCRWWSPATAAIASAWWSTASWASATSASRRWTPGWARCPISAAPRCSRTAGRS